MIQLTFHFTLNVRTINNYDVTLSLSKYSSLEVETLMLKISGKSASRAIIGDI